MAEQKGDAGMLIRGFHHDFSSAGLTRPCFQTLLALERIECQFLVQILNMRMPYYENAVLKERDDIILSEVVRSYLSSGQPVGSRILSDHSDLGLSPASIRNVMSSLEQKGMLYAPHTSAGRVPTDAGLRYFVDSLMVVDENLRNHFEQAVAGDLLPAKDVDDVLHRASDELARLTHFAGLVSVHEPGFARIRKIELVPVSSEQVLAVIVSDENEVQNRLLPREANISDTRLAEITYRLNEMLVNCDLAQVRARLRREMDTDRLHIRRLLDGLMRWAEEPARAQEELFVSGQRHLLEVPELSVIETVRSLLTAFEEKESLLHLISEVEGARRGVKVFIGREHALVNMDQISVVLANYEGPGQMMGTLGVIGPKRMPYERVMPIVDCTAKWVSRMFGGKH